jgi:hypothetical protein
LAQVRFALIDRRRRDMDPLKSLDASMLGVKREYFLEMVGVLVDASPVDTGNYIESHSLSVRRSGGMSTTTSHGLPRHQSAGAKKSEALERLQAAVMTFDDDVKNVYIRNAASGYASLVEWKYGYAPYRSARDSASRILNGLLSEYRI